MKRTVIILLLLVIAISLFANETFRERLKSKIDKINVSSEVKVFLISMIPIFELRGAIPLGILAYKLPIWKVFPIAIAGNMVPIFFILLFFDFVTKLFFKVPFLKKILETIFRRTRSKSAVIEKYEEIGLMFFVAIPLPITGAWTGSLAAYLFGLSFWKSILFIFFGVLIAGVVVSFLTSLKWLGAIIAAVALIYVIISNYVRKEKNKRKITLS
ncbi:MAG: small multi-drug export protein [Candidatus Cloacimonetes bacterium]|nr:small multi-drug export protein [Candidatus Cloacimonadota bacterium]